MQDYESYDAFQELQSQGTMFCFIDPDCGNLNTIVEHEVSSEGYEHVRALMDFNCFRQRNAKIPAANHRNSTKRKIKKWMRVRGGRKTHNVQRMC